MRIASRLALIGAAAALPCALIFVSAQASSTVSVPASAADGISTGIYVTVGDTVTITATGTAGYGYEGAAPCAGYPSTEPNGSRFLGSYNCGPKDDPNALLPGDIGLLIGKIGSGSWFNADGITFRASATGDLYLAYNDDIWSDNTGSYSASIMITIPTSPPPCIAKRHAPDICCNAKSDVICPN